MIDQHMPDIGFLARAAIGAGGMWIVHVVRYGILHDQLEKTNTHNRQLRSHVAYWEKLAIGRGKSLALHVQECAKRREHASALGRAGRAAQIARAKGAKAHTVAALGNTPMRPRDEVVVSVPKTAGERKTRREGIAA